jgi:PAS domain S-box-containing protein
VSDAKAEGDALMPSTRLYASGARVPRLDAEIRIGAESPPPDDPRARASILLAGGSPEMRRSVHELLDPYYDMQVEADGSAGLAALHEHRPDVLLASIAGPGLDGLALVREIRASSTLAELPIILIVAHADRDVGASGLAAGADDFIVEPIGDRELRARIAAHLERARQRRDAERRRAADLQAMTRLREVANLCGCAGYEIEECLKEILDAAIAITGAQRGYIQLLDAEKSALVIAAQRGFEAPFLKFFARVDGGEASACGAAFRAGERVAVEDVVGSAIFAGRPSGEVMLAAGARVVQSTPLTSSAGAVLGMISTHFTRPHRPGERELRYMDLLARQAADYLERKGAEQALRAVSRELEQKAEMLATALSHCSRDLRIISANRACAELLGLPREQIIGRPIVEVMGDQAFEAIRPYFERALRGERVEFEAQLPYRVRGLRWVHVVYVPYRTDEGDISGWVASVADISERKSAEAAFQELTVTLEQKVEERSRALETEMVERQKAEAALERIQRFEAIGQLTGGMAHDFNNLLTVILCQAEKISLEADGNERIRHMAGATMRAAERGAQLTNQLLSFAGRQRLRPVTLAAYGLLQDIGEMVRRTIGETIIVDVLIDRELWLVRLDPAQLESAILNLAINARDAMPSGGLLTITAKNTTISADDQSSLGLASGDYVVIRVADTGVGMSAEVQHHAFEPFYTTKEVGKGTGLGLAQVYGFARQSGGTAAIESLPGDGTTAVLYLPRASGVVEHGRRSRDKQRRRVAERRRILLVEDQAEVRHAIKTMLDDLGHIVSTAADGVIARSVLESKKVIDLLLTDVVMPNGISGLDLARDAGRLRPGLKIVVMSGYLRETRNREIGLPGVLLLEKPFDQAQLAEMIAAAFGAAVDGSAAQRKYRLLLLDEAGAILGRDDFDAEDDRGAIFIADMLYDACSDRCARFELYQNGRRLDLSSRNRPVASAEQIRARTQEIVREREQALYDSRMAIAESKRLLERLSDMRGSRSL